MTDAEIASEAMTSQRDRPAAAPRLVTIDGLRGIASLMVVLHHASLTTAFTATLMSTLPEWLIGLADGLRNGVIVFFVISGFVIAHSMRSFTPNVNSITTFIAKRQMRLDPPYWVTLIVIAVISAIAGTSRVPSARELISNALYAHHIIGDKEILRVPWTLCIEIQFYLAFVFLLFAFSKLNLPAQLTQIALSLTIAASLFFNPSPQVGTWFFGYWCFFALGVLACWVHLKRASATVLLIIVSIALARLALDRLYVVAVVLALTVALLHMASVKGKLTVWLGGQLLQYLGRISYSLYLIHVVSIGAIARSAQKIFPSATPSSVLILLLIAIFISVACAHLLNTFVEQPSQRFSARFAARNKRATTPRATLLRNET